MATLAEIQDAMADLIRDNLDDITDLQVQVEPRMIVYPTPPTIDIYPGDPSEDPELASFGDLVGGELIVVRARVHTADSNAGQDILLALMDDEDPLSIVAALDSDPTLGGAASDTHMRGRGGFALFEYPGGDGILLGCLLNYIVVKARS